MTFRSCPTPPGTIIIVQMFFLLTMHNQLLSNQSMACNSVHLATVHLAATEDTDSQRNLCTKPGFII